MSRLDRWLPEWDARERHEIAVADSRRALAAALALRASGDPIVRMLLRLRGLPTDPSLERFFSELGFGVLLRTPAEFAAGAAGTPWRPGRGLRPFADASPGTVRMVLGLWAEPGLLVTETRVAAVDEAARRAFARYWRAIGPFSALIRRRWLRAAARASS